MFLSSMFTGLGSRALSPHGTGIPGPVAQWPTLEGGHQALWCEPLYFSQKEANKQEGRKEFPILPKGVF